MGWEIHIYRDGKWEYWDFCTTFEQIDFCIERLSAKGIETRIVEYGYGRGLA